MQVGLNTRIPLELRQALDAYAEETKKPIAQIVKEALEQYLKEEK